MNLLIINKTVREVEKKAAKRYRIKGEVVQKAAVFDESYPLWICLWRSNLNSKGFVRDVCYLVWEGEGEKLKINAIYSNEHSLGMIEIKSALVFKTEDEGLQLRIIIEVHGTFVGRIKTSVNFIDMEHLDLATPIPEMLTLEEEYEDWRNKQGHVYI